MKLEITKENAIKAHSEADSQVKGLLENLFGKQVFVPAKITDRVKTLEDAYKELGIDPYFFGDDLTDIEGDVWAKDCKSVIAYIKLIIVARALNEGWEPDWSNDDEYKYYPWFDMSSGSGSGFSSDGCDYTYSRSSVGSRLCFKTRELAEYAGKQFEDLYRDYFTITA